VAYNFRILALVLFLLYTLVCYLIYLETRDKTVIGRRLSFDSQMALPHYYDTSGRSSNRFALPVFFPITTNVNYLLCFRHARSGRKRFVTYWICFLFFFSFISFCSISGQTTKRLNSLLHILIDTTAQMFQVWLSLLVLFIAHRCFFLKKKK
jgi:hypothetical protein